MHCGTVFAVGTPRNSAVRILLMVHGGTLVRFLLLFFALGYHQCFKDKVWTNLATNTPDWGVACIFFSLVVVLPFSFWCIAVRFLLLVGRGTARYGFCCWYAAVLCGTDIAVGTLRYSAVRFLLLIHCSTVFVGDTLRYSAVRFLLLVRCGTLRYGFCCWYAAVRCVTILVLYAAVRCGTVFAVGMLRYAPRTPFE